MDSKIVISVLLAIILHSITVLTERNIIPSIAVCNNFPNEEFAVDLGRCQNTCEYYGRTWDCPTSYYKPNGDCYCKPGFARIQEDGICVSVSTNATCKAKLPIQPSKCNGRNEMYTEALEVGVCDKTCRTFGCKMEAAVRQIKWGPNCVCGNNDEQYAAKGDAYKRLSNGTCVVINDDKCVSEMQPSPERCAALGQIYTVNAPCQKDCYGKQYCPNAGPTCVCPPNKLPVETTAYYVTLYPSQYSYIQNRNPVSVLGCYTSPESCPESPQAAMAGR